MVLQIGLSKRTPSGTRALGSLAPYPLTGPMYRRHRPTIDRQHILFPEARKTTLAWISIDFYTLNNEHRITACPIRRTPCNYLDTRQAEH